MPNLSIIVPVYNEAGNILELSARIQEAFSGTSVNYEIIFVNDRSSDGSENEIIQASKKYKGVVLHNKIGKQGKAFCIVEGAQVAKSDVLAMIDGDLQYPPEKLPEMYQMVKDTHGVVVANRRNHKTSFLRKIGSKINVFVFEKLLHGFNCDAQSGLKVFKREIISHLDHKNLGQWSLDMPLLHTALELGHTIGGIDIDFEERKNGESKVQFIKAATEIGSNALKLKFKKRKVYHLHPQTGNSMIGAGVAYKKQRFITHTTLPHHESAFQVLAGWQKLAILILLGALFTSIYLNAQMTAIVVIAVLTVVYFSDFIFSFFVLMKSMHFPPEVSISEEETSNLDDSNLPIYSILCPLYKEAQVLPIFLESLSTIDYPKNKLDVLLLLEENDQETIDAAYALNLPKYVRVVVVPHSMPKTKPKACNYGLSQAKGEYVVIYDAEDRPDPLQLKKAVVAFNKLDKEVFCLQCKLNYYNPNHNILTRLFTAEYSLWFDIMLPGLQSINTTIPLGGTSNHFRTKELISASGWDPFNVTEDCDLGVRIFKKGYKTAVIDSTTYEEANSHVGNWIRQRSRWIKGYFQTYLVHMREPITFFRTHKHQAIIFQLVIGMRMFFILINPILWATTISYFVLYKYVGPQIESLYPTPVFYMGVICLIFGNFMYLYNYMIGCAKREQWSLMKYVFFVPVYWVLTSIAAAMALWQLVTKPHYWEKTRHGLHLNVSKKKDENIPVEKKVIDSIPQQLHKYRLKHALAGGAFLVFTSFLANILNLLYNVYLGREVDFAQFGTITVIGNIFTIASVFTGAIGKSVSYRTAFFLGKYKSVVPDFFRSVRFISTIFAFATTTLWILATPFIASFFNETEVLPYLLFAPFWTIAFIGSVNSGFLSGTHKFHILGISALFEAISKFSIALLLVEIGMEANVYIAIPASMFIAFIFESVFVWKYSRKIPNGTVSKKELDFPYKFVSTSILNKFSAIAFLSVDVILAKHFLSPEDAGIYALLSLIGKMVYFLGTLFIQFLVPVISRLEGEKHETLSAFYKLLLLTIAATTSGFLGLILFGNLILPAFFGSKAYTVIPFLPIYVFAMVQLCISYSIVTYHQVLKHYSFPIISFTFSIFLILSIFINHSSLNSFIYAFSFTCFVQLIVVTTHHLIHKKLFKIYKSLSDTFSFLFAKSNLENVSQGNRILIYNWRDTKHVWAGGAEVYVHEIAKRWVDLGYQVTLFCGNDQKSKVTETIDGINIVRLGGFYTVYVWAFVCYIFKFRGNFDIVIDAENGIPFFTPLYVKEPKILLIHHVHQEVFMKDLRLSLIKLPIAAISKLLEAKIMPYFYKNVKIVTVSESSRKDIIKLGMGSDESIQIVNPGINKPKISKYVKTKYPSVVYLGRLKSYKNVDIAIKAFSHILNKFPQAKFTIAGQGEEVDNLKKLVNDLNLQNNVKFVGYITEVQKMRLLGKSWVAVQPSSIEGWGITVIEANSVGTPVVASRIHGLSDSVSDTLTGFLVTPKNEREIASAFEIIFKNTKYRMKLSARSIQWSENFSWDKSSRQFLNILINELGNYKYSQNSSVIYVNN